MSDRFSPRIAYFSMEIALEDSMPTYSGGLGVLAGDTLRAAADLKVPVVGVSLLYHQGYFFQHITPDGVQTESPENWIPQNCLTLEPEKVTVKIEGRKVIIQCWSYKIKSPSGHIVPVYFLDTKLPENSEYDQKLSDALYSGDNRYRLCQEVILGIGGLRMLRAKGYNEIDRFHLNEGHASLLTIELLSEMKTPERDGSVLEHEVCAIRDQCVFTTHTPVPAGHDKFPEELVKQVLDDRHEFTNQDIFYCDGKLNMTYLALQMSGYVNGVALKHGEVSQSMFQDHKIEAITNGVYAPKWISPSFEKLFDVYLPNWREDNFAFRYALNISNDEIKKAHLEAKQRLFDYIHKQLNLALDINIFTIGFARRAATYKRADLIFQDIERLKGIGKFQIIFAGKAHPQDDPGKALIKRIHQAAEELKGHINVVYLENYDTAMAKLLTSGCDLWLNTPRPPQEASGTSGMKAAMNGVPSLSVLDGWWIEGCIEGITGWSIGHLQDNDVLHLTDETQDLVDFEDLVYKLERIILPMFYENPDEWMDVMKNSIALNGSFFNTQRMVQQYVLNAYFRRTTWIKPRDLIQSS